MINQLRATVVAAALWNVLRQVADGDRGHGVERALLQPQGRRGTDGRATRRHRNRPSLARQTRPRLRRTRRQRLLERLRRHRQPARRAQRLSAPSEVR